MDMEAKNSWIIMALNITLGKLLKQTNLGPVVQKHCVRLMFAYSYVKRLTRLSMCTKTLTLLFLFF